MTLSSAAKLAPPFVDRLNMIGEPPLPPERKSEYVTYTLPAHGLAEVEFVSTSIHSLSVNRPTRPATPGTANPTAPRLTTVVPA